MLCAYSYMVVKYLAYNKIIAALFIDNGLCITSYRELSCRVNELRTVS